MTAKVKTIRVNEELLNTVKTAIDTRNIKSFGGFMETAINLLPLLDIIQAKGLTIEQAVNRLNQDDNVVTIIQTIRKGANEKPFDMLMEKIVAYNLNCKDNSLKIALTPSIFYNIIGGNVKAIKGLFESKLEAISKHNSDMGLDDNWNRKLAKRVDTDLYSWIKKTVAFNV